MTHVPGVKITCIVILLKILISSKTRSNVSIMTGHTSFIAKILERAEELRQVTVLLAHLSKNKMCIYLNVEKPERKRSLGRPRRRWEDGIRMDLREIDWGVEWIPLAQYRGRWCALVNVVMNLRFLVPQS
jgi:hypothetical protein